MIKGLLFILVQFAVLWLALWMFRTDYKKRRWWAPYEIRGADPVVTKRADAPVTSSSGWRARRKY